MIRKVGDHHKLLVIIVKKGLSSRVIRACKKGGSEGATVIQGRGTGIHDTGSIFGVKLEPEKDLILCLCDNEIAEKVLSKVRAAVRLDRPGTGVAFLLNSRSITGIAHLLDRDE